MTSIRHDALGLFVFVILYSSCCCAVGVLLVCMLWRYRERASYVALISVFVTLSTTGSIIQQIHYAVDWSNIKASQYEEAKKIVTEPSLAYSVLGPKGDVTLFWIQFYCYNVLSLLILFWTISLFISSWNITLNWRTATEEKFAQGSKIFAVVFPLVMISIVQWSPVVKITALRLILNFMIMVLSLTAGSVLLILILIKYINTRRLTTRHMRRSGWWQPASDASRESALESGTNFDMSSSSSERTSIYDRALIIRFSIAFVLLALFEIVTISFEITQKHSNETLATLHSPDYTLSKAQADLVGFIPGVTASLVVFVVFGTTRSFSQYKRLLLCASKKRPDRRTLIRRTESRERVVPSPMLPSPEMLSPMTMSPNNSPLYSPRDWAEEGTELSGLTPPPPSASIPLSGTTRSNSYPLRHLTIRLEDFRTTGSQNTRKSSSRTSPKTNSAKTSD